MNNTQLNTCTLCCHVITFLLKKGAKYEKFFQKNLYVAPRR